MLEINDVCFSYEDRSVLKNINLHLNKGERAALLGNNGCGKTTLFKCICGLLKPKSGTIKREDTGLVFQEADSQIIGATVEKEVSFGLMNMGLRGDELDSKIDMALNRVSMQGYKHNAVHYLSGGEKKRVCIADIIAMQPQIILFDEPTAYLDNYNTQLFKGIINDMDSTMLISTHDIDLAYEIADRFIIMSHGEIIADGGVEIFAKSDIIEHSGIAMPKLWQFAGMLGYTDYNSYPRTISELREMYN